MKQNFSEDTKRQIERLYILLREGGCDVCFLSKLKMEIDKLWQQHKDSLDVKTLYFLFLYKSKVQKKEDVLHLISGEDLGFSLLREIDDIITGKIESPYEELRTRQEVSEIIHNCIYSDLSDRFDEAFSKTGVSLSRLGNLKSGKTLNEAGEIINYFKFNFTTEPEYKEKILYLFEEKAKEFQGLITKGKIKWCKTGEKIYNKCINFYLSKFFKQIHCEKEAPLVDFKFQKGGWKWIFSSPSFGLSFFTVMIILGCLFFLWTLVYRGEDTRAIFATINLLWASLSCGILLEFFPTAESLKDAWKFTKNNSQKGVTMSVSCFNNIDEIINQAVKVLNNIPKNEKIESLSDKIQKYQVLLKNFNSLNAPTSLSSLNVYLTIFLNNIIDKKEKLSLEDLNLSNETFSTANSILMNQTEQNKVKELESKHLELEIAKREIDFLANLNLNQEIPTKIK